MAAVRRLPRTATVAIGAATILVSTLVSLANAEGMAAVVAGAIPARLMGGLDVPGAWPAIVTPLSAAFLHGGFFHLAMNMLLLFWCGSAVERVIGRGGFLLLYAVGAYASAYAQALSDPTSLTPMIGASGAVSAVIGAFSLTFGQSKAIVAHQGLNRALNIAWLLAAWVVIQAMVGKAAGQEGLLLATAAHIGGFIAGLVLQRPLLLWRYRAA